MRSPVSSRLFLVSVEQVLEGFVLGGVVGDGGGPGVGVAGVVGEVGDETWLPVRSLIGARRRSSLSTVRTPRVTAGSRRSHNGRQTRQASRAVTQRHLGCIGNPSKITDQRTVHR
jgi:hypothetical protein